MNKADKILYRIICVIQVVFLGPVIFGSPLAMIGVLLAYFFSGFTVMTFTSFAAYMAKCVIVFLIAAGLHVYMEKIIEEMN